MSCNLKIVNVGGTPDTSLANTDQTLTGARNVFQGGPGGFPVNYDGDVSIAGKLTVVGIIDPTGLQFTDGVNQPDASMPTTTLYVTDGSLSGAAPGEIVFKDAAGNYHALEGGSGTAGLVTATAADIGTPAPAGAQLGVDPATGEIFYVDAAGDWQAVPVISEVVTVTAADIGTAAPAGAVLGSDPATGQLFSVDAAGDWQAASLVNPIVEVAAVTAADIGTAAPADNKIGFDEATGQFFYKDAAGDWQAQPTNASTPPLGLRLNGGANDIDALLAGRGNGEHLMFVGADGAGSTLTSAGAIDVVVAGEVQGAVAQPFAIPVGQMGFAYIDAGSGNPTVVLDEDVAGVNLFNSDGTLQATRLVTMNGNNLTFLGAGSFNLGNVDQFLVTTPTVGSFAVDADGIKMGFNTVDDLRINGDAGTATQYLGSQGQDLPPVWRDLAQLVRVQSWVDPTTEEIFTLPGTVQGNETWLVGETAGQDFTPTLNGSVESIQIAGGGLQVNTATLEILQGNGITGTPIHTQAIGPFDLDNDPLFTLTTPVPVTAGQTYSIRLSGHDVSVQLNLGDHLLPSAAALGDRYQNGVVGAGLAKLRLAINMAQSGVDYWVFGESTDGGTTVVQRAVNKNDPADQPDISGGIPAAWTQVTDGNTTSSRIISKVPACRLVPQTTSIAGPVNVPASVDMAQTTTWDPGNIPLNNTVPVQPNETQIFNSYGGLSDFQLQVSITGDFSPANWTSGGTQSIAFLNVPAGTYTVRLAYSGELTRTNSIGSLTLTAPGVNSLAEAVWSSDNPAAVVQVNEDVQIPIGETFSWMEVTFTTNAAGTIEFGSNFFNPQVNQYDITNYGAFFGSGLERVVTEYTDGVTQTHEAVLLTDHTDIITGTGPIPGVWLPCP